LRQSEVDDQLNSYNLELKFDSDDPLCFEFNLNRFLDKNKDNKIYLTSY